MKIKVEKPTRQFPEERKVSSWGIWEKEIYDPGWVWKKLGIEKE
jgi:hypothetical protein